MAIFWGMVKMTLATSSSPTVFSQRRIGSPGNNGFPAEALLTNIARLPQPTGKKSMALGWIPLTEYMESLNSIASQISLFVGMTVSQSFS
jgi:hypothetical protein